MEGMVPLKATGSMTEDAKQQRGTEGADQACTKGSRDLDADCGCQPHCVLFALQDTAFARQRPGSPQQRRLRDRAAADGSVGMSCDEKQLWGGERQPRGGWLHPGCQQ